ncbi:MAG: Ig-like domain-containing protein, partial [Shewanella sp.]
MTTTVQNGVWEVSFADVAKLTADGTYSWTITATDIAGNSKELTGNFTFDSTPLDIEAKLLSDSGFDSADNVTNSETLQIQVNVNDTASSVRLVLWPASGAQSTPAFEQTLNFSGSNQYGFDIPSLAEGEYQYCVIATDIAGNVSEMAPVTITIDRTPPAISDALLDAESDTSLVPGKNYSSDPTPSFSGKSEVGARVTIEIFDKDGKQVAVEPEFVVADENGNWQFVLSTELIDGDYTWVASALDAAGNKNSTASQVLHIDTTPPVITDAGVDSSSDSGVSDSDSITNDNTVTFKGVAEKGNVIELKIFNADAPDTPAFTFGVTVSEADGSFSFDTTALPDGTYYWEMVATDAAGNLSEAVRGAAPLIVDTKITGFDAGLDVGSDSGDQSDDDITNQSAPQLSGKGEVGATVSLNSLTNSTTGESVTVGSLTAVVDENGNWQLQLPTLPADGVYDWSVTITDIAGNSQTLSGS